MVLLDIKNSVATVTLDRASVKNAFNPEMIQKLTETFRSLSAQADLRLVVLKGAGDTFCAGADLNWMKEMVNFTAQENKKDSVSLYQMFDALWNIPVPVMGVVQGSAFGGALGLIACCDEVFAVDGTQFCFSEVRLGLVPAVISSFILRKANRGVIDPLMINGKVFGAGTASMAGLVQHLVAADQLEKTVNDSINHYLSLGPVAVRAAKKLLHDNSPHSPTLDFVTDLISKIRVSPEGQEGLKSFLEKKSPSWKTKYEAGGLNG